jgi:uncharacterized protein YxjI
MALDFRPGEQYVIRKKLLKLFGAAFYVYDPRQQVVAFCNQKAFRLREDIRLYTSDAKTEELLVMKARSIIDFGATYDVTLPTGELLGSLRRRGLTSSFVRDSWLVFDRQGREIARLEELGGFLAFARRYVELVAIFSPQSYALVRHGGQTIAEFRRHFNLISSRMSISVLADDPELDDLMVLAIGCLIAAIEGRQQA